VKEKIILSMNNFLGRMLCGITSTFEATESGTKMTDVVHYALPLGFIGRIMNTLVVKTN
jgi:hypothetical protein